MPTDDANAEAVRKWWFAILAVVAVSVAWGANRSDLNNIQERLDRGNIETVQLDVAVVKTELGYVKAEQKEQKKLLKEILKEVKK